MPQNRSAPGEDTTTRLRVLFVFGDDEDSELFGELLDLAGYAATGVRDPRLVVETAMVVLPEIILLDIDRPGIDGYALAARLRTIPELAKTALIAITGYGGAARRAQSETAGFTHHVVKPIHLEILERCFLEVTSRSVQ